METCEMCWTRKGTGHLVDDNAEVTLCRPCAKELRSEASVEVLR